MDRRDDSTSSQRVRVWDLAVRIFHWSLALLVLAAFLTGDEDESNALHVRVGLGVLALVVFRVVWGVVGSKHARFADFVRAPHEVLEYAKAYVRGRPAHHLGHNPLGGVMVVMLLAVLGGIAGTGILMKLGPEWGGALTPWMSRSLAHGIKEAHEVLAGTLIALSGLHVAGVLLSSWIERQNLVGGMITGWKRSAGELDGPPMSFGRRAAAFVVAVLVAAGVAIAVGRALPEGEAEAAVTPRALLDAYRAEVKVERPAFADFDAARGRALYFEQHDKDGKATSCATCHTDDARAEGRSPAGKVVEPLAPSANAARFTDRKKADKWFDRNCKQVLGRLCTAEEKGNVMAWLLTL